MSKRSRPEKQEMTKWNDMMKAEGAIIEDLTARDSMGLASHFDCYMFMDSGHRCMVIPCEHKAQRGGKRFSYAQWRKSEPHQLEWLLRFLDMFAHPILVVHWQPGGKGKRWKHIVIPIKIEHKVLHFSDELSTLPTAETPTEVLDIIYSSI